jgi:hypothetical protein
MLSYVSTYFESYWAYTMVRLEEKEVKPKTKTIATVHKGKVRIFTHYGKYIEAFLKVKEAGEELKVDK